MSTLHLKYDSSMETTKTKLFAWVLYLGVLGPTALPIQAQTQRHSHSERAEPAEVVMKVRKAAALLAKQGAAGLAVLRDSTSEFTWKDTYVFVVDCDADEVLANPAFPERQGGDIKQHTDYNGFQYGPVLCETAKRPHGGWLEYVWPRPGGGTPARKISYVVSVDGLPYQVGAGIYNEQITIEALYQLTQGL